MQSDDIIELTSRLSRKPISILIADDSESNQDLFALYFKKTSCTLDFADNGRQAVEKFKTTRYDIVLMDILMPVMDGLTAIREIRSFERDNDRTPVPVLAVTANSFEEDRQQALDAGCSGFLAKPIRKSRMLECVAQTMERLTA